MKVSIITPSYNQGIYIAETIKSVLSQGDALGDYVIVDGASKDSTLDVLGRFLNHPKVAKIISEPDKGQTDALQKGVAFVNDEIMGYLNSDDVLEPGALESVVAFFQKNPGVDVWCGARRIIGPRGRTVRCCSPMLPEGDDFFRSMLVFQEATFWRRSAFDKCGGYFDVDYRFAMDFELLSRMRAVGARFAKTNQILGRFRVHDASKTSSIFWDVGMSELRRIWKRHGLKDMEAVEFRAWTNSYLRKELGWSYFPFKAKQWLGNRMTKFL